MDYIDLRSDTVTWPTPAMKEAMMNAPLGDDVYEEDPTVNALEAEAAEKFGKEAALFVSSGTQGNTVAMLTHCGRGDEVILGKDAHTFKYEVGNIAALGGINPNTIAVQADGTFDLDDVREAIRGSNVHFPKTRLIAMENTHGGRGGVVVSKAHIDSVVEIARAHGLGTHIDGARIFNAVAKLETTAADLTENVDTVSVCLSKGLCAPVGSVLVGPADFIKEARRWRKALGGGMRQAGIIAAAGRVALRDMTDRLSEDHENACTLAEGLAPFEGIHVDVNEVHTNFVYVTLDADRDPAVFEQRLWDEFNIKARPYPGYVRRYRFVTHYYITPQRVQQIIEAVRQVLA